MGTRLAFEDIPFETPEPRAFPHGEYIVDDQTDLHQEQTPLIPEHSHRTPGTVRFHPNVSHGQQTLDQDYYDDRGDKAVRFHWDREEQVNFDAVSMHFLGLPVLLVAQFV